MPLTFPIVILFSLIKLFNKWSLFTASFLYFLLSFSPHLINLYGISSLSCFQRSPLFLFQLFLFELSVFFFVKWGLEIVYLLFTSWLTLGQLFPWGSVTLGNVVWDGTAWSSPGSFCQMSFLKRQLSFLS